MRARRILPRLVSPVVLTLLSGCGYVHLGKLPAPAPATVIGDAEVLQENSHLKLEKKLLQQELAITRAQGDALRVAIQNRAADGDTSRRLTQQLNESSRELATLRAGYAQLQIERDTATASAREAEALRSQLGVTEEKLAVSLRNFTELQQEIGRLRTEVDRTRAENLALGEQVKAATVQNEEAQAALAQLNTQLFAQKDARARAEQDAETLRTQLRSVAPDASSLAQQRTGAAAEARSLAAEHAAEVGALKQELDASRAQIVALANERAQLQAQLGVPGPALAQTESKLSQLRDENQQLAATKAQLENQLAQLKNGSAAAPTSVLREQLREAQAQAAALTEENARLKGRVALTHSTAQPVRIELAGDPSRTPPAVAASVAEVDGPGSAPAPAATTPIAGTGVSATLVTTAPGSNRGPVTARIELPGMGRVHVVAGGDTLSKISAHYYGTPNRWNEILAANRDILGENNNLVIGRALRIP